MEENKKNTQEDTSVYLQHTTSLRETLYHTQLVMNNRIKKVTEFGL